MIADSDAGSTARRRIIGATGALSLAVLLGLHGLVSYGRLRRAPDWDEAQYLHGAWLVSQGQRLYRDFFEHHTPHLYALLRLLKPSATSAAFPLLQIDTWFERARLVVGAMGTLGVLAAAVFAARVARRVYAAVFVAAALLGSTWTWQRGVVDARNDPPTLMLFWVSALLIGWRRDGSRAAAARTGLALGLLFFACAWNPKWPLTTLAVGAFGLFEAVRATRGNRFEWLAAIAPLTACAVANVAVIVSLTTPGDYFFYVFSLTRRIQAEVSESPYLAHWFQLREPLEYCSPLFRPAPVIVAWTVVFVALVARRSRAAWRALDLHAVVLALALAPIAGVELVCLTGPYRWAQHYLMWSFTGAVVLALVPSALEALFEGYVKPLTSTHRTAVQLGVALAATIAGSFAVVERRPSDAGEYWDAQSRVQRLLKPGDRVWVRADEHPIAAYDASFYWFSFGDAVPAALRFVTAHPDNGFLPRVQDEDLPLCRALRGTSALEPSLRLSAREEQLLGLPKSRECYRRLTEAGRLTYSPLPGTVRVEPVTR